MKEETNVTSTMSARQITMTALFVALVAVGAFIKIPIPNLPFTLQFHFTIIIHYLGWFNFGKSFRRYECSHVYYSWSRRCTSIH